jgi:hypothetical protein
MFDKNEDFIVVKLGQVSCVVLSLPFEHELIQCVCSYCLCLLDLINFLRLKPSAGHK